jgi:uncharacterized protein (TIGR02246 family)
MMSSEAEDKDAVRELLARCCRLSDDGDAETMAALFSEDGVWEAALNRAVGRPAIIEHMARFNPPAIPGLRRRHLLAGVIVTLEGDGAAAQATWMSLRQGAAGPEIRTVGSYDDLMVKEKGNWLIRRHRVVAEIAAPPPAPKA